MAETIDEIIKLSAQAELLYQAAENLEEGAKSSLKEAEQLLFEAAAHEKKGHSAKASLALHQAVYCETMARRLRTKAGHRRMLARRAERAIEEVLQ